MSEMSVKDRIRGAKRPRRSKRINLRGDLVAEIERLDRELREVREKERDSKSRRLGDSRATELADQIEALREEMAGDWLELILEPRSTHEWRAFRAANPAREGDEYDQQLGLNFDKLAFDYLPLCVVEPTLDKEDWDILFDRLSPGDLRDAALMVFTLHEAGVDIPKSLQASAVRVRSDGDSEPPSPGE